MTIQYRDTEPGVYRSLRVWQDDQGKFVIDCERTDGTLGAQEWEYDTLAAALADFPMLYAVQVLGARVVMVAQEANPAQASAPARWHVYRPLPEGGEQATVHPSKRSAEWAVRVWAGAETATVR